MKIKYKIFLGLLLLFVPTLGKAEESETYRQLEEENKYHAQDINYLNQLEEDNEMTDDEVDDASTYASDPPKPSEGAKFVPDGRKFFRSDKNYHIYASCPINGKAFPKTVAESQDYTDDLVAVSERNKKVYTTKEGDKFYYEKVSINGNFVGWVNINVFRKNELRTVPISAPVVDVNDPFYSVEENKSKLAQYNILNASEGFVDGIGSDGYMMAPNKVKGTGMDITKAGMVSGNI